MAMGDASAWLRCRVCAEGGRVTEDGTSLSQDMGERPGDACLAFILAAEPHSVVLAELPAMPARVFQDRRQEVRTR